MAAVAFNHSIYLQVWGSVLQRDEARTHAGERFDNSLHFSSTTKEERGRGGRKGEDQRATSFAWLQPHTHTREKSIRKVFIGLAQWLMAAWGRCMQAAQCGHSCVPVFTPREHKKQARTHTHIHVLANHTLASVDVTVGVGLGGWSTCTLANGMEGSLLGALQLEFPRRHSQSGEGGRHWMIIHVCIQISRSKARENV